jgi:hypothetical protein
VTGTRAASVIPNCARCVPNAPLLEGAAPCLFTHFNRGIAIEGPAALAQIKIGAKSWAVESRPGKGYRPTKKLVAVTGISGPPASSLWPTPSHFKWENGWPILFFVSDLKAVLELLGSSPVQPFCSGIPWPNAGEHSPTPRLIYRRKIWSQETLTQSSALALFCDWFLVSQKKRINGCLHDKFIRVRVRSIILGSLRRW